MKSMEVFRILSLLFGTLCLSSVVNCSEKWCPCIQRSNSLILNSTTHVVTSYVCEKYKGVFFSEERDFKCECCLIIREYKESCKPAKNPMFVVRCGEGLYCGRKYTCLPQPTTQSFMLVMKNPTQPLPPSHEVSQSFENSFAEMLKKMFGCDCSKAQCDNEVTRQECEEHQGLFVDKLSVRNRCQCCDKCYIPRGQHQSCAQYHKKNVQYVCDTGLYCSPFTHMCIEKREIFSQFLNKVKKENTLKKRLGVFDEDESQSHQSVFIAHLTRKKRDDEEAASAAPAEGGGDATPAPAAEGGAESTAGGEEHSSAAPAEGGEAASTEGEATTTEEPTTTTTPVPTTKAGKGKGGKTTPKKGFGIDLGLDKMGKDIMAGLAGKKGSKSTTKAPAGKGKAAMDQDPAAGKKGAGKKVAKKPPQG